MASRRIIYCDGKSEGQLIPIDADPFFIGRNPECQLSIPSTYLARRHCQILHWVGKFYIEDLKSYCGVCVNLNQIGSHDGRVLLRHGDQIRVADFRAVFEDARDTANSSPDDASD
jgi:pSer/pThr/pTyr-binding forkhead associated (FHA) protein